MASRAGPGPSSTARAPAPSITTPLPVPSTRSPAPMSAKSTSDPILRNALRYTISAREYGLLHKYVISRSRVLKKRAPTVDSVQKMMEGEPGKGGGQGAAKGGKGKGKGKDKDTGKGKDVGRGMVVVDDYNARAVRHSLRVFVATGALMKLWEAVSARLAARKNEYVSFLSWGFAVEG